MNIQFKKLSHAADLPLPSYESKFAAGMDIRAALEEPVKLSAGERELIPTALRIALRDGF
jgi:dUTP pyrophosphatase